SYSVELKANDVVSTVVDFVRDAGGDQIIRRDGGNFRLNGFDADQTLFLTGSGPNNGTYTIKSVSIDGSTIVVTVANTLTATQITSSLNFVDEVIPCSPSPCTPTHVEHIYRTDGHDWTDSTTFGSVSTISVFGTGGGN